MKLREAGGVAAAVVAVVGLPAIVAETVQTTPAEKPPPVEAALTAALTSAEKQGSDESYLRVLAKGAPPPGSFRLLNPEGKDVVKVGRSARVKCADLPLRQAPARGGSTEWCLNLRGIRDASEVSGVIVGKETKLTLTVSRRSNFLGVPALVVVLGLLLGIALPVIPLLLSSKIRKGLVDKEVTDNEGAGAGQAIAGLAGWVERRRQLGQKDDGILPLLDWVINTGPKYAAQSRERLRQGIEHASLPPDHPYRKAAGKFVESSTKLKVSDFLKEDGKREEPYPGDKWVEGLTVLEEQRKELENLEFEVESRGADSEQVEKALENARQAIGAADRPGALADIDGKLRELQRALPPKPFRRTVTLLRADAELETLLGADAEAQGTWLPMEQRALGGPQGRPHAETRLDRDMSLAPQPLSPRPKPDRLPWYRAGTIALILFVVGLAILTIELTIYRPVADFGDFADYFALASASIAAGVSSSVVALLAPWNPSESAAA